MKNFTRKIARQKQKGRVDTALALEIVFVEKKVLKFDTIPE